MYCSRAPTYAEAVWWDLVYQISLKIHCWKQLSLEVCHKVDAWQHHVVQRKSARLQAVKQQVKPVGPYANDLSYTCQVLCWGLLTECITWTVFSKAKVLLDGLLASPADKRQGFV